MKRRLSTLELKGAALSVLWCLLDYKIVRGVDTVGTQQLVRETGYSRPSLRDGLDRLTANGYIVAYETRGQGGELTYGLAADFPTLFSSGAGRLAEADARQPNAADSTQTYPTLEKIFLALGNSSCCLNESTDLNTFKQPQQPATLEKNFTALPLPETPTPVAAPDPIRERLLALGGREDRIGRALARRRTHGDEDAALNQRIDQWLDYLDNVEWEPANRGAFITTCIGEWRGIPAYTRRIPSAPMVEVVLAETPEESATRAQAEQARQQHLAAHAATQAADQANPAYPILRQIQAFFAHQACAERVNRLRPGGLTPDTLTLLCPPLDQEWLETRLLGQLRNTAASIVGRPISVKFDRQR